MKNSSTPPSERNTESALATAALSDTKHSARSDAERYEQPEYAATLATTAAIEKVTPPTARARGFAALFADAVVAPATTPGLSKFARRRCVNARHTHAL